MKDKEKQITINREAGATADLLNKEIEELQKANAIVEMQNVVCKRLCNQDCRICNYYNKNDCIQKDNVDALYERGYRKLPEDSVVLSREEYEKLRSLYDCEQGSYMTSNIGDLPLTVEGLRKAVDEITRLNKVETELQELNAKYYNEAKDLRRELKQASKETAEKILKDFKLWAREYQNKDTVIDGYGERPMTNNEKLNYLYTYLCDKYKVEIKE